MAADLHKKIELNDFLAGLSIVGSQEKGLFLRFLFRVYDMRQCGRLDRRDVEKILVVAYGDKYKAGSSSSISRLLNKIFSLSSNANPETGNTNKAGDFLTLKDFQQFDGRLDILG